MTSSAEIKKWITQTLSQSASLTALCTSIIDSKLNFYRGTPINDVVEEIPYFTVFTDESNADYTSQSGFQTVWNIPCALAIAENITHITDGDVIVYEVTDNVERLANASIEVLKAELRACNLGDIRLMQSRVVISQIGEADDIQANIFLTFGELSNI